MLDHNSPPFLALKWFSSGDEGLVRRSRRMDKLCLVVFATAYIALTVWAVVRT